MINTGNIEWECTNCNKRNSANVDKCSSCYKRRAQIFSTQDIQDLNQFAAINFSSPLSPSHSAPNPITNTLPIIQSNITCYNDNNLNKFDAKYANIQYHKKDNNYNNSNMNMNHIKKEDLKRNRSNSLHRQRINRSHNAEIFDIYTNKQKTSLLPVDIQIGRATKIGGAPSVRVRYDEDFNPSTSPSPSSSISSHQQFFHHNFSNNSDHTPTIQAPPSLAPATSSPSPSLLNDNNERNMNMNNNKNIRGRRDRKRSHSLQWRA